MKSPLLARQSGKTINCSCFPGGDGQRIGEAQSSVRGRDEAEEWAAAEEAAREEERLALAETTLSYIVSGAHDGFGKCPGTGIYGLMDVVTGIFRRDPELSSTNSVLVTVATCLETALLCPMLGGYDTIVEGPTGPRRMLVVQSAPLLHQYQCAKCNLR